MPRGVIPGPTEIDSGFVKNEIRLYCPISFFFTKCLGNNIPVKCQKVMGGGASLFLEHVKVRNLCSFKFPIGAGGQGTFWNHQRIMMTSLKTQHWVC